MEFAIGVRRTAPLWRLIDGVPADGWTDAIDMTGAQVTVAEYCQDWWPAATRLLIRRVRLNLDLGQVSGDPRSRRRRTLHPDERALPLDDLAGMAEIDGVYAYSFVVANLEVSTAEQATAVEHWYRHQYQRREHPPRLQARRRAAPTFHDTGQNRVWVAISALAADLLAWCARLALPASAAGYEP